MAALAAASSAALVLDQASAADRQVLAAALVAAAELADLATALAGKAFEAVAVVRSWILLFRFFIPKVYQKTPRLARRFYDYA